MAEFFLSALLFIGLILLVLALVTRWAVRRWSLGVVKEAIEQHHTDMDVRIKDLRKDIHELQSKLERIQAVAVAPLQESSTLPAETKHSPIATLDTGTLQPNAEGQSGAYKDTATQISLETQDIVDSAAHEVSNNKETIKTEAIDKPAAITSQPARVESPSSISLTKARSHHSAAQMPEDPIERGLKQTVAWFVGGNLITKLGLIILVIGLSFMARYVAAQGLFPIEYRLAVLGLFGMALLGFGFVKAKEKPEFALPLQGGGIAIMYLTVFAASKLYGLLPPLAAFAAMVLVCACSCVLALLQNTPTLAMAAFAGGFATPVLLSTGQGSHVALFSYYTLLNAAIVSIAYFRAWRMLNVLAFVATFGVACAWGVLKFDPIYYASTQPFLIVFVVLFTLAAALYAQHTPTQYGNAVDNLLVFGTPLIGFGLQYNLVTELYLGSAFSALGFGLFYLTLATVLLQRAKANDKVLIQAFLAIGIGFVTMAVPLALGMAWTSAIWAIEGLAAVWVSLRQQRPLLGMFGFALQAIALLMYIGSGLISGERHSVMISPSSVGALILSGCAMTLAWWFKLPSNANQTLGSVKQKPSEQTDASPKLSNFFYLYGYGLWIINLSYEVQSYFIQVKNNLVPNADNFYQAFTQVQSLNIIVLVLAILISNLASTAVSMRKQWSVAAWPSYINSAMLLLVYVLEVWHNGVMTWSIQLWILWMCALLIHGVNTYCIDTRIKQFLSSAFLSFNHMLTVWLITGLLASAVYLAVTYYQLNRTSWSTIAYLISAILVLAVLTMWAGRAANPMQAARMGWPLNVYAKAYYWQAAKPLVVVVYFGSLAAALLSAGNAYPLPYIALLNPLELTLALSIVLLLLWVRLLPSTPNTAQQDAATRTTLNSLVAALAFVVLNTVWLRSVHHYVGVAWNTHAMFDSQLVQMGYAILWTLCALGIMLWAHRGNKRPQWMVGATLLAVVVIKLFLVDLSSAGTIERMVAFIVVGVLMLVVGYLAPLPPKRSDLQGSSADSKAQA